MEKALTVYKASAGSGKTFTLASEYITLVVKNPQDYKIDVRNGIFFVILPPYGRKK